MGGHFDALKQELREAVIWTARRNMEEFGGRHPNLASVALAPSTLEELQENIAKNGDLREVLARYKAAVLSGQQKDPPGCTQQP